jgi:hypothetical protein
VPLFLWLAPPRLGDPVVVASDDEEWLEPAGQMGIWEYQPHPLTVGDLRRALDGLPYDAPGEVDFYDGSDCRNLGPLYIDLKGNAGVTSAVVITVR